MSSNFSMTRYGSPTRLSSTPGHARGSPTEYDAASLPHLNSQDDNARTTFTSHSPQDFDDSAASSSIIARPYTRGEFVRLLFQTWRWEFLTWLLGTCGLATTIVILIVFNGKPQHEWRSNVQITAIVAALAQLSQSALLVATAASIGQAKWRWLRKDRKAYDIDRFDLASRGPDGALRLLWYLRMRPHLVTLGALSTILMLAFPIFVQQSVSMNNTGSIIKDTDAFLYRATNVTGKLESLEPLIGISSPSDPTAIISGITSQYINPANVTGICATGSVGRCAWKPFTTLAVCSSVENVTDKLVSHDQNNMPPTLPFTGEGPENWENTTIYSKVSLPVAYLNSNPGNGVGPANQSRIDAPFFAEIYVSFYDACLKEEDERGSLSGTDMIRYWNAYKATMYPCLQTLNSSFEGSWRSDITGTPQNLQWRYIIQNNRAINCVRDNTGEDFCMDQSLKYDIGDALYRAYNFSLDIDRSPDGSSRNTIKSAWTPFLIGDIRGARVSGPWRDPCIDRTKPFRNFGHRMENIAASLGIAFRSMEGRTVVNGTAWSTVPTIEVTFVWLLMPIILYFMITFFFFTTIARSKGAPPWKSSALALMKSTDPHVAIREWKEIKDYAVKNSVRLDDNGETWHLAETHRRDVKMRRREER
ncbi:hypothetical protein CC86DRAFT_375415 [Ophiobolus disseminans]|uniref:Uncharacterized protein n=1 Tax=Ophiobolus disseminans TaxID=1469910 RepID=A0A6A6ZD82_9PLEO|nr:hypothetical protein CC86DRAFT_375415 [Ophiobolus disseminans]